MAQKSFGSGDLILTRTDTANPTPRKVGILQEVNVDFKAESKELFGGREFAEDVASGKKSITWKAKYGAVNGRILCEFLFNASPVTGLLVPNRGELGAVPGTSAYTVTVTNAATFYEDAGVILAETGQQMERVAASPATGQYAVSNGVYTFAAAQAGKEVLISYLSAPAGSLPNIRMLVKNRDLGEIVPFSLILMNRYRGKTTALKLFANTMESGSLPFKMDDYMLTDIAGKAFADDAGRVMEFSASE